MINNILSIIILLFLNVCAELGQFVILILICIVYKIIDGNLSNLANSLLSLFAIILFFGRLFVLPIGYKIFENSKKYRLVAKFVYVLKNSNNVKILVLILAHCIYFLGQKMFHQLSFFESIISGIVVGLTGSYIVLFAYWWIEGKIKKFVKHKKQEC